MRAILAMNLLSLYQAQVTAKAGWRQPSTLRAAVFASLHSPLRGSLRLAVSLRSAVCGALLCRAGRKLALRLSQNGGGLEKHQVLIDNALDMQITIAPLLPRPRELEQDFDTVLPGGDGI